MFSETSINILMIPAFVVAGVFISITQAKLLKEADPRKRVAARVRIVLWAAGGFLIYLWLLLPSTPALSTFGYPKTTDQVDNPQKILFYFKWYNREIVRIAEIMHWVIFVGVFFIGAAIDSALREFTTATSNASNPENKEIEKGSNQMRMPSEITAIPVARDVAPTRVATQVSLRPYRS